MPRFVPNELPTAISDVIGACIWIGGVQRQLFDQPWKRYLFDINASTDVDTISETVESVFESLARDGPSAIDLTTISASQVNGEHLAALLRATSSWRDQIPGWDRALIVASKALELANVDPKAALAGML